MTERLNVRTSFLTETGSESLQRSEVRTKIAPIKLQCTLYHGTCIKLRICQQKMHHLRLHELNVTKCPLGLAKIFSIFFFCWGAFYSKMFKWGRQGARTILSLSEDLLFLFLTVRHILVQICVCVRLFIWGRQILCILKRVKIFPKQSLSQKENHSQLESLLVRHYTTLWECMFIWKMIGG